MFLLNKLTIFVFVILFVDLLFVFPVEEEAYEEVEAEAPKDEAAIQVVLSSINCPFLSNGW